MSITRHTIIFIMPYTRYRRCRGISSEKMASILEFYFRFRFDLIFVISVSFYSGLPNFIQSEPPAVEL